MGGIEDTGDDFGQWLVKWEFSDVCLVKQSLCKQGIKSSEDLMKFVSNNSALNKLLSRLKLNFRDEISLERAWKSVHSNEEKKVVFLGDAERKIMDDLYTKYDVVSKDVESLQKHITQLHKDKIDSLNSIDVST